MVEISNEDLKETYHYVSTITNILQKEINQVNGNKSYLDKMLPTFLSKTYSLKETKALAFVKNLDRTVYESNVVALVSTFERIVFAKYQTTYGTVKSIVTSQSKKPMDYFDSKERFVNDSIDKLSGILFLLEGLIDNELFKKLKLLKDHRNYIAHGKRDLKDIKPPSVEFTLDEITTILDDVIKEIEK
jgi:uncharacterized protein YutE (UPF0331/DUF86 family)